MRGNLIGNDLRYNDGEVSSSNRELGKGTKRSQHDGMHPPILDASRINSRTQQQQQLWRRQCWKMVSLQR